MRLLQSRGKPSAFIWSRVRLRAKPAKSRWPRHTLQSRAQTVTANHDGRDFLVAKCDEGFYAALAANQIVTGLLGLLRGADADLNGLFQAEILYALQDLL